MSARASRWAVAACTLATVLALLLSSWSSWRSVRTARTVLIRGQAEALLESLRSRPRREHGPDGLRAFVEAHREEGLRRVVLLGPEEEILESAGDEAAFTSAEWPLVAPRQISIVEKRGLVLVRAPAPPQPQRPPRRPGAPPPWLDEPPPREAPGDRDDLAPYPGERPDSFDEDGFPRPDRRARRPLVAGPFGPGGAVLELEPVAARQLERAAAVSLALGAVAAAALLAAAAFLMSLLRQREQAAARLADQQRLSSLGEMSAVLAHEIKNPLASLKGHAQLLAEKLPDGGRERERADRIVSEAVRLEELARRLLDHVRAGRVERAPCDPSALLREAAASLDPSRIDVDVARAPASWPLDALRVRQVLANLLENALQASPEGARVTATAAEREGRLVYEVRDRGPGLPPGDPAQLFEPFRTTRVRGTGLGLSIARSVVELHGGRIAASNHPEGGALFVVALPRS